MSCRGALFLTLGCNPSHREPLSQPIIAVNSDIWAVSITFTAEISLVGEVDTRDRIPPRFLFDPSRPAHRRQRPRPRESSNCAARKTRRLRRLRHRLQGPIPDLNLTPTSLPLGGPVDARAHRVSTQHRK